MRKRSLAGTGLLTALVWAAPAVAQDDVPVLRVRQIAESPYSAWGSRAAVTISRDAFVTVYELGIDGRIRILFPETPKENAFRKAERTLRVHLPSPNADFQNVDRAPMRVPVLIAIGSDVRPDLSDFGRDGNRWTYQYVPQGGNDVSAIIGELATRTLGDPNIPYGSVTQLIAPSLTTFQHQQLIGCGLFVGNVPDPFLHSFVWDVFGRIRGNGLSEINDPTFLGWNMPVQWMASLPMNVGVPLRSTSQRLWNTYGVQCPFLESMRMWVDRRPIVRRGGYLAARPVLPADDEDEDENGDKDKEKKPKDRDAGPTPGEKGDEKLTLLATGGATGTAAAGSSSDAAARQESARRAIERLQDDAMLRAELVGGGLMMGGGGLALQREPMAMLPQQRVAITSQEAVALRSAAQERRRAAYEATTQQRPRYGPGTAGSSGTGASGAARGSVGSSTGSGGGSSSGARGGSAGGGRGSSSGRGGN